MVKVSSTREVWVSYQAVRYQDIPRLDSGVDGYPEEAQTVLIRHLVNQEYGWGMCQLWSQSLSETVICQCALGNFPLTEPMELTA